MDSANHTVLGCTQPMTHGMPAATRSSLNRTWDPKRDNRSGFRMALHSNVYAPLRDIKGALMSVLLRLISGRVTQCNSRPVSLLWSWMVPKYRRLQLLKGGEMGYDDVVYRVPAKLDPDTGAFALHQVSPHHTLGLTLTLTWPSVNRTLRGKNRTSAPLGYGEATVTRLSGCVSS
eukprot:1161402-Pelagomonas_calceolata.AAC.1